MDLAGRPSDQSAHQDGQHRHIMIISLIALHGLTNPRRIFGTARSGQLRGIVGGGDPTQLRRPPHLVDTVDLLAMSRRSSHRRWHGSPSPYDELHPA